MWVDHFQKEMTYVFAKSDGTPQAIPQLNDKRIIKFAWSKNGAYLAAFYPEGIQLFGGKDLEKLNFYEHHGVKNVEFSPDEKYILTFNGTVLEAPDTEVCVFCRSVLTNLFRTLSSGIWAQLRRLESSKLNKTKVGDLLVGVTMALILPELVLTHLESTSFHP